MLAVANTNGLAVIHADISLRYEKDILLAAAKQIGMPPIYNLAELYYNIVLVAAKKS